MESRLNASSIDTTTNVYGRGYDKDLEMFFKDISLRQALAVFSYEKCISNPKHLSDLSGLSETESLDKLEALRNLGLIKLSSLGYVESGNNYYVENVLTTDRVKRASDHSVKLVQIASQITKSDDYANQCVIDSTSPELAKEFHENIIRLCEDFVMKNKKIPNDRKNVLFTYASAYVFRTYCK
jgi:hypothetical protein